MNYKELYNRFYTEPNKETIAPRVLDIIHNIDAIAYKMMLDLPDPDLWQMLEEVCPTIDNDIVFLCDTDSIDYYFEGVTKPSDVLSHFKGSSNLDFNKNYLIEWDDTFYTVDAVCDIDIDWWDIYQKASKRILWDWIDPDEDEELVRLFAELKEIEADDFHEFNCSELNDLMFECWKHRDDGPEWVKLSKVLENAFNRIAEGGNE